jgi:hypothetical protein
MAILNRRLAALALGLAMTALASPSNAQGGGTAISPARAAAIHECSVRASHYIQHTWGNWELYTYRACMAEHGQPE